MTDSSDSRSLELAADFEAVGLDQWRRAALESLKGKSLDGLGETTLDGLHLDSIYTAESEGETPGPVWAMQRGGLDRLPHGWLMLQRYEDPDPRELRSALQRDLEGGIGAVELRLDRAARSGHDAPVRGAAIDGIPIYDLEGLDELLEGVHLDWVEVGLDAGAAYRPAAAMLAALCRRRELPLDHPAAVNADPFSALVSLGELPQGLDAALDELGDLAAWAAREWPILRVARADGGAWSEAGCSDAQELGIVLAAGVAYLRAMTSAGLELDDAASRLSLRIHLDPDFQAGIARLRALRLLWARVIEASGGTLESASVTRIEAATARRSLSRCDPAVNLLRATATTFAAVIGGADRVLAVPFDAPFGVPSALGLRLARNTQLILAEESGLHRVADPAAGAWYYEERTRRLAEAAWQELQRIESAGGLAAVVLDGSLAHGIEAVAARRAEAIARRRLPLTGTSEFPELDDFALDPPVRDRERLAEGVGRRLAERRAPERPEDGADPVAAALTGASLEQLMHRGDATRVVPLTTRRWAEPFERLREAAEAHRIATGARPRVFLANLGSLAEFNARATFMRNLLAAGGIEAVGDDGYETSDAVAAALHGSGLAAAVLCSTEARYDELAASVVEALRDAGARWLGLAGSFEVGGLDRTIARGDDALELLQELHRVLGIEAVDGAPA